MTPEGITRHLIAILSADVKDYTRLISQDDVGTIRTLTACKEAMETLIKRYRGQVVDATGDNLLARFDSVLDAVNAAAEMQRDLSERNSDLPDHRKMEFRMGVSLGDVVEEEGRIYGDGVNIAARLQALAEGGGICISSMVHDHVQEKLGFQYEDLGEQTLKNIAKPIRVYRLLSHPGAAAHRVQEAKKSLRKKWVKIALAAGAVLIIAAGLLWRFVILPARAPQVASVERMAHPLPDRPSIAVLPFENLSKEKSQDYIADGMTEDIISALARFKQLFVIARNSTQTYKGKAVKIHQVAEELGVRYVLEGSMEISKDRIRVTAQLIDAIAGTHLWVERFDRPLTDVFEVRDELTRKIVASLVSKLEQAEMAKASLHHPTNLDAYGLFWQGLEIQNRFTPSDNAKGRELYEKTIALDPKYTRAYVELAWTYFQDWMNGWVPAENRKASYQKALDLAYKAVALDPTDGYAHVTLGFFLLYGRRFEKAVAEFEEGLKANPNDAGLLVLSSQSYLYVGRPEECIKRIKEAMRLNPNYPNWYMWILGSAQYAAGDYEGAVETFRKMSPMGEGRSWLAASLAQLGRMEEARAEAKKYLKDNPSFSASDWGSRMPYLHEKDRQHAVEGFLKAGLPR
jgi:TolB-like protein/class 3 adenylate cyclase/Tfp pilus assembly protein PilF